MPDDQLITFFTIRTFFAEFIHPFHWFEEIMFILKKLVSRFFFPLSLVIELLLLGIFLKKRRTKVILAGGGILYLFSFSPFGYLILRPLESQYVPISSSSLNKEVQWIVVLGGGSREDKALTPEDRLGEG